MVNGRKLPPALDDNHESLLWSTICLRDNLKWFPPDKSDTLSRWSLWTMGTGGPTAWDTVLGFIFSSVQHDEEFKVISVSWSAVTFVGMCFTWPGQLKLILFGLNINHNIRVFKGLFGQTKIRIKCYFQHLKALVRPTDTWFRHHQRAKKISRRWILVKIYNHKWLLLYIIIYIFLLIIV